MCYVVHCVSNILFVYGISVHGLNVFFSLTFLLAMVQNKVLYSTKWHVYTWRCLSVCSTDSRCAKKPSHTHTHAHLQFYFQAWHCRYNRCEDRVNISSTVQPAMTSQADVYCLEYRCSITVSCFVSVIAYRVALARDWFKVWGCFRLHRGQDTWK